jgi:deazaflavin-dependent oxidoreductase (nitroreductase family)
MQSATGPRRRRLNSLERLLEDFARSRPGGWFFVNVATRIDPTLLRLTGGRLSIAVGQPVLLLRHRGAKSGRPRETALLYTADGERLVLVASKAGSERNPAWYHNLKAHPEVSVLAPGRSGRYVAREAEGAERDRLWELVNDLYRGYGTYQARTGGRRIPVMVLEPEQGPAAGATPR